MEEKVVLQTHVGSDADHRLRSDRFATILQLGSRVIPSGDLDVDVEYDCCVVAQYPIAEAAPDGEHLNLSCSAAGHNVERASVVRAKQQPAVAPRPQLVVSRHGSDPNLSVLLRSHAIAHSPSPWKIPSLRLPFSGHSG